MSRFARRVNSNGRRVNHARRQDLAARCRDLYALIDTYEPTGFPDWMDPWVGEMLALGSWRDVTLDLLRAAETVLERWLGELVDAG
jgi:hypothetical protein